MAHNYAAIRRGRKRGRKCCLGCAAEALASALSAAALLVGLAATQAADIAPPGSTPAPAPATTACLPERFEPATSERVRQLHAAPEAPPERSRAEPDSEAEGMVDTTAAVMCFWERG